MYLNDFQTDNSQFLSELAGLQVNQGIAFHPIGKEYDEYTIKCSRLCNCTFLGLYKKGSDDILGLYSLDDKKLFEKVSDTLTEKGITRVSYKKVGELK